MSKVASSSSAPWNRGERLRYMAGSRVAIRQEAQRALKKLNVPQYEAEFLDQFIGQYSSGFDRNAIRIINSKPRTSAGSYSPDKTTNSHLTDNARPVESHQGRSDGRRQGRLFESEEWKALDVLRRIQDHSNDMAAARGYTLARLTSPAVSQDTHTLPPIDPEAVQPARSTFENGDHLNHLRNITGQQISPSNNTIYQPAITNGPVPSFTLDGHGLQPSLNFFACGQSPPLAVSHVNTQSAPSEHVNQPVSHPRVKAGSPLQSPTSTTGRGGRASGSANNNLEQDASQSNQPAAKVSPPPGSQIQSGNSPLSNTTSATNDPADRTSGSVTLTTRNTSGGPPSSNTFLVSLAKPARKFALRMAEIGLFRSHDYTLEALRQDINANPAMINSSRYRTVQHDLPLTAFEQRFISKMVVEAKIVHSFATKWKTKDAMAVGILVTVNNGISPRLTITAKIHPSGNPSPDGRVPQPQFLAGFHRVPKTKPTVKTHNTDKGINGGIDGPEPSPVKLEAHIDCCSSYDTEHSPTTKLWLENKNLGVSHKSITRLLCEEDEVARKGVHDTIPLLVLIDRKHPGPIIMTIDVETEQHVKQQLKVKQLPRLSLGVAAKLPMVVDSDKGGFEGEILGWSEGQWANWYHEMKHC